MLGFFCLSCQVSHNFKIFDKCLHLEGPSVIVRRSEEGAMYPGRERVNQGQQFDEMQRQQKNPDGSPRNDNES